MKRRKLLLCPFSMITVFAKRRVVRGVSKDIAVCWGVLGNNEGRDELRIKNEKNCSFTLVA